MCGSWGQETKYVTVRYPGDKLISVDGASEGGDHTFTIALFELKLILILLHLVYCVPNYKGNRAWTCT